MPEDDFDIYGEDEGFNSTKPVEVSPAALAWDGLLNMSGW